MRAVPDLLGDVFALELHEDGALEVAAAQVAPQAHGPHRRLLREEGLPNSQEGLSIRLTEEKYEFVDIQLDALDCIASLFCQVGLCRHQWQWQLMLPF